MLTLMFLSAALMLIAAQWPEARRIRHTNMNPNP